MRIHIIDCGLSNLASASRACERLGADVSVGSSPEQINTAPKLMLPGVGSFPEAMSNLRRSGLVEPIRKAVLEDGIPLIGICLGMQLLASWSDEAGGAEGLNIIPGKVERLTSETERVPHVGWNEVDFSDEPDPIFDELASGTDFYFVHSFCKCPSLDFHDVHINIGMLVKMGNCFWRV